MDHWAYRTDDDELPEKESTPAAESKLHQLQLAQMSADGSSGKTSVKFGEPATAADERERSTHHSPKRLGDVIRDENDALTC